MALDWIKIECALPDKPEVLVIARACRLELDSTLGKLLRLFVWYDRHLTRGDDPRITREMIDALTGHPRFADAMVSCGWLLDSGEGSVRIANFERHNGKNAKHRALSALRMANKRGKARAMENARESAHPVENASGYAPGVMNASPREEKRRTTQTQNQNAPAGSDDESVTAPPALPEWLPLDAWQAFVAMRVKIKKPMTDEAARIALQRLGKWRAQGHDVREILDTSTLGGYQGLFEPRGAPGKPAQQAFAERDYKSGATNGKDIPWLDDGSKAT